MQLKNKEFCFSIHSSLQLYFLYFGFCFLPFFASIFGCFYLGGLGNARKIKRPLFLKSSFKEQGNLIQKSPTVFWTFIGQSCEWGPFRLTELEFPLKLDTRTFYPEFFDEPSRTMYFGNIAEVPQGKKKMRMSIGKQHKVY